MTVLGGPMAGTQLAIDAVDEILIGSDPDCRLALDLPGVSPIHARVWRDLAGITVYDTHSPRGLYINDDRVVEHAPLHDGDVLWLGAPGDADSVMIQCRLPEESILGAPVGEPAASAPVDEPAPPAAPVEDAAHDALSAAVAEAAASVGADVEPSAPVADLDAAPSSPDMDPAALVADSEPSPPAMDLESGLPFTPASAPMAAADEPPPIPVAAEAPEIITEAWAEQAAAPAMESPAAASPVEEEGMEFFTETPDVAPAAPTPMAAPVTPPPSPAPGSDDDFVMDPAWAEYDAPVLSPPPPVDIDALLADAPAKDAAPSAPTPPAVAAAPTPIVTTTVPFVGGKPVAPKPVTPAATPPSPAPTPMVTTTAPIVGTAPTPAPPRAIIDDTRSRPARKPEAAPRRAETEGVMDWAKGAPRDDEEPAVPPMRPAARAPRSPPRKGRGGPLLPIAGAVVLIAALGGGYYVWSGSRAPRIDAVSPTRATAGATLTLTGAHLGESLGATTASIGGLPARVTQASGDRLQIEVPDLPMTPGRDIAAPIVVTANGRESQPASVAVYQAPRLRSLTPEVAMPGETVVVAGTSLGPGAKVHFGDVEAELVDAKPDSLTVRVPPLPGGPGAEVPVVAAMGTDRSTPLTFVVGKVPLVTGIEPRSASPGDLVTLAGRGFSADAAANRVTVGGVRALVVSATPRGVDFVVPRVIAGQEGVAITVPRSTQVGQIDLAVTPLPEPIGFHFVAEPFEDVPGHEHAAVATGLGPAFVLTSGQGKSAAERAYEVQKRLNDAAQVIRSTRTADIRARYAPAPALFLAARDTILIDVVGADAEAYNEDWTRGRGPSPPVTPARLATWWEAVARDLVLLLLRGEKPEHAQALAPEGKVFADIHDAARRTVSVGVPSALVAERAATREALRAVALRVPAGVAAPVTREDAGPGAAADAAAPPLRLEGSWRGMETESGVQKPIRVVFRGGSGTLTYERALSMSVPVLAVQQPQKGTVRFEVRVGSGTRYYRGRWDGARITGKLTSDAGGRTEIGEFELDPS